MERVALVAFRNGGENFQLGVRKVVVENRAEIEAELRHAARAALAETEAMPLTGTFQNHRPILFVRYEVVARNSVPAEQAIYRQAPDFSAKE